MAILRLKACLFITEASNDTRSVIGMTDRHTHLQLFCPYNFPSGLDFGMCFLAVLERRLSKVLLLMDEYVYALEIWRY